MRVSAIVAASDNGVIGRGNKLPWHLPADLRRRAIDPARLVTTE